jgi:hypothetical protein
MQNQNRYTACLYDPYPSIVPTPKSGEKTIVVPFPTAFVAETPLFVTGPITSDIRLNDDLRTFHMRKGTFAQSTGCYRPIMARGRTVGQN